LAAYLLQSPVGCKREDGITAMRQYLICAKKDRVVPGRVNSRSKRLCNLIAVVPLDYRNTT